MLDLAGERCRQESLDDVQQFANYIRHHRMHYSRQHDPHDRISSHDRSQSEDQPGSHGQVLEIGLHGVLWDRVRIVEWESSGAITCKALLSVVFLRLMGMPSLLRKVFLVDLLQGLKVTFRYQDPKEIYTEQYPLERPQVAERYRGAPRLNVNPDTDETMCIACDLCALACPEHLIVVSSERNEKTRRKELTNFTYDLSRCMFCGLCEDACPTDALELTQDFELASYTRQGWIWDRPTLEKGPQPTQYKK